MVQIFKFFSGGPYRDCRTTGTLRSYSNDRFRLLHDLYGDIRKIVPEIIFKSDTNSYDYIFSLGQPIFRGAFLGNFIYKGQKFRTAITRF